MGRAAWTVRQCQSAPKQGRRHYAFVCEQLVMLVKGRCQTSLDSLAMFAALRDNAVMCPISPVQVGRGQAATGSLTYAPAADAQAVQGEARRLGRPDHATRGRKFPQPLSGSWRRRRRPAGFISESIFMERKGESALVVAAQRPLQACCRALKLSINYSCPSSDRALGP